MIRSIHVLGALAEITAGLFYVPADVVTQRLQIQSLPSFTKTNRLFTGPKHVMREIIKQEGIKGLYRGYLAHILTFAPVRTKQI